MTNEAPVKSIILSGSINSNLCYKLCPSTEFSEGVWNISISSVAYRCKAPNVNEISEISCNLVKSQKLNSNYEVESYDQPFGLLLIKSSDSKKIVNFGIVLMKSKNMFAFNFFVM